MLKALLSTLTETLDSKKWIGSYVAAIGASVLHVCFGVSIENALLLMGPITIGVLGQAHVDASAAKGATIREMAVGQLFEPPATSDPTGARATTPPAP